MVDDQRGQPTWSYALAEQLVALGDAALAGPRRAGVYHGTAPARPPGTGWPGPSSPDTAWTRTGSGRPPATGFPVRPARPAYSVLGHDRWAAAGLPPLPDWHTTLVDALRLPRSHPPRGRSA